MSRSVFIFGAGASRQAGGPLMSDLLDVADRERFAENDLALVERAQKALRASYANADLDLRNIESLWAAFEMVRLVKGALPGLTQAEIDALDGATKRVLRETISHSIRRVRGAYTAHPPVPYGQFARQILVDLRSACLITFNYDVSLEQGCLLASYPGMKEGHSGAVSFHYGGLEPGGAGLPLLKLHGSLGWGECGACHKIVTVSTSALIGVAEHGITSSFFNGLTCCGGDIADEPVIVPPTWTKTQYHQQLAAVWSEAARQLADAVNLFIIGYSLPETDHFFRYLFGIGAQRARFRRIRVYDPFPDAVIQRFVRFLGPEARRSLAHTACTFEEAIPLIRRELREDDTEYWTQRTPRPSGDGTF